MIMRLWDEECFIIEWVGKVLNVCLFVMLMDYEIFIFLFEKICGVDYSIVERFLMGVFIFILG